MRRCWHALSESVREDDPFTIRSVIKPVDMTVPPGFRGTAARYWQRRYSYPSLIRKTTSAAIGHVLDHSWADMLRFLPSRTLKVVTVHDLIPMRFPGELTAAQARRFQSWVSNVRCADAIIAVSEYSKHEITDLLGISPEIVTVVPCGVELPARSGPIAPLLPSLPGTMTVGCIGSTIDRKNLKILPAAFAKYGATAGKRLRLVRVGAPLPASLANELRYVLGSEGLIELGYLSDADVGRFYQSMGVVVVPSLYEGFGLPVLEALAHGVPVISSKATSLPEVGGEEALYFDPLSADDLAVQLTLVAGGLSDDWRVRAVNRAKQFSWRASLEGIYSVYHGALDLRDQS